MVLLAVSLQLISANHSVLKIVWLAALQGAKTPYSSQLRWLPIKAHINFNQAFLSSYALYASQPMYLSELLACRFASCSGTDRGRDMLGSKCVST